MAALYFKKETEEGVNVVAFHGEPQKAMSELMGTPHYALTEEAGFYGPNERGAFYELSTTCRPIRPGFTPISRAEFEAVKASALAAINALMGSEIEQLQAA